MMRAAVLHFRDLRVRIVRVGPVRVRALLFAGPVEPGQLGARRRREAGRLGQPGQKCVGSSRPCPAARCSASPRFQRRGIDASRAPHHQRGVGQSLQHPGSSLPDGSGQSRRVLSTASSGPAGPRPGGRSPESVLEAQRCATRSLVPSPALQSSRATAAGNTGPAPDSADRPRPRRTTRTVPPRTHRTPPRRAPDSVAVKRVPSALWQIRRGHPHCRLLRSGRVVSPSPCPTVCTRESCRSL